MLDVTRQKMLTFALDRDGRDVTEGLNFQQFLDKMRKAASHWKAQHGKVSRRPCFLTKRTLLNPDRAHSW